MSVYQLDLNKPVHVHFIGIGGISMSGIAHILLANGFNISGSDMNKSAVTDELEALGATIKTPQKADNITDDIDLVVYTAAIHPDNPEYQECKKRNIPMETRADILGQLMKSYGKAICVSGTHGKTTTTAMVAQILMSADTDPTVSLGGILPAFGNIRIGKKDVIAVESCEYTNSFLSFFPTTAVILNIAPDHLDFFKDLDDIRNSFRRFAELVPQGTGKVVINSEIDNTDFFKPEGVSGFVTFGLDSRSDYYATDIAYDKNGFASYTLICKGEEAVKIQLHVPGLHNVMNSLAAAAATHINGVDFKSIAEGLSQFTGTKRRFEYKGEVNGVKIIDDYAHHPDEIKATLAAIKNTEHNRLWVVFQPHTYTRTKALLNEFAECLSLKNDDHVIIAKIFPAREEDIYGVHSEDLAKLIADSGSDCQCINSFEDIAEYLKKHVQPGDCILTMGAGDVFQVGEMMLK